MLGVGCPTVATNGTRLGDWVLSSRSNIKNHNRDIETFLEWIKPFIDSGSGKRDMYAIKISEEQSEPTIYYLYDANMEVSR